MIDSIIFDVDGTLWDSTDIVARAWNRILEQETDLEPTLTGATLKGLFGRLLPDIAAVIFEKYEKQRQLELIDLCCEEEHRELLAYPAPVYDTLEEALQILSERYPLYIVSNCQAGYIEVFLKATGLGCYFQDHLCPGDTGKAKAENIRTIIRRHNLKSPCMWEIPPAIRKPVKAPAYLSSLPPMASALQSSRNIRSKSRWI